jgi:glycosyltransferase involved in cell wall biosynthesis
MIHNMGKFMKSKGHDVRVLLYYSAYYGIKNPYEHEGIMIFPFNQVIMDKLFRWADRVCTHLDYTQQTIHLAMLYKKPVVHLIHNTHPYDSIIAQDNNQWIVYNSHWAKEQLGYKHPSMVVYPPCDWRQYDTGKDSSQNEYITLINMDQNKGGHILKEIAKRMPEKKFLGVKGSYSEPALVGQIIDQPSNVTILDNTPNIMPVYEKTRILIMPSKYESWGRTATEAMCSGIPVISSGTPGLRENCGKAGIYVDRDDIDGWVTEINKLDKPSEYRKRSEAARKRSRELDPTEQLEALHDWLLNVRMYSQSQSGAVSTASFIS